MRSRPLFLLFCLVVSIGAAPDKNQKEKELQQQLFSLKAKLQDARETLQNEIAERWGERQRFIEKREVDKEELERLAEQQEKAFGAVASIKEEIYSLERRLEEAERNWKIRSRRGIMSDRFWRIYYRRSLMRCPRFFRLIWSRNENGSNP
jgi:uncharacterized protein (DUF342 family)